MRSTLNDLLARHTSYASSSIHIFTICTLSLWSPNSKRFVAARSCASFPADGGPKSRDIECDYCTRLHFVRRWRMMCGGAFRGGQKQKRNRRDPATTHLSRPQPQSSCVFVSSKYKTFARAAATSPIN